MDFNKMTTEELSEYAKTSDKNYAEVSKWMNIKRQEIKTLNTYSIIISCVAILISIAVLVSKTLL